MDMVTRILMEPRRPPEPGTKPRTWGQKHEPDLVLVIFDTAVIDRMNEERYSSPGMEESRLKRPPGKYALAYEEGFTDSGIFAQVMLTHDQHRDAVVWFDEFTDLPFAVQALRERYPDVQLPEQVSYMIDWPLNRDNLNGGKTVVITAPAAQVPESAI